MGPLSGRYRRRRQGGVAGRTSHPAQSDRRHLPVRPGRPRRGFVKAGRRTGGQASSVLAVGARLGLVASLTAAPLAAQVAARRPAGPPPRPPGSEFTISLMAMGVGERVWERFGHNAILVEDRLHGTARAYNYGMFDFRQENFLLNFVKGRMWY